APGDSAAVAPPGNYSGAAYVFERAGPKWEALRLESPEPAPWDWFGASVAVAGDTVVVAEAVAFEESTAGTVFVFEYVAGSWVGSRIASAEEDQLGWSLAAGEGVILAGAPEQEVLGFGTQTGVDPGTGYAFVMTETDGGYATRQVVPTEGDIGGEYGYDIDIDSGRLVVGAPRYLGKGAAYLYRLAADGSGEAVCTAWDATSLDLFGRSVAIDGNILAVGSPLADDPARNSGAVYIFEAP
ncbi:MAG: FG-GAP repeat protein, partial [Acidimicrobiia bacterium]|nr:FG-GAP repeat protein [Acidimicrobiia bacterium]